MASPGPEALKIVLVSLDPTSSGDDFKQALIGELERRKIVVLQTSVADAEQDIDEHQPHLVVLCGTRGASVLSTLLDDGLQGTRPRLVVTALRSELAKLQGLNRNVVAGLLASDLGERLVVERLQTLARQAAQLRQGLWKKRGVPRTSSQDETGKAPRLSANPATPEFFKGVDTDILDPLFPSTKPAPPKSAGPTAAIPRPIKPKESRAEAFEPTKAGRAAPPEEAPPSPKDEARKDEAPKREPPQDEAPAAPPAARSSGRKDPPTAHTAAPTPPRAASPAPPQVGSPKISPAPQVDSPTPPVAEPSTAASPHPAPVDEPVSSDIEDLSELAEPASSHPPEPETPAAAVPVAPPPVESAPEPLPASERLPAPEPPQVPPIRRDSPSSTSKRTALVLTGFLIVGAAAASVWVFPTWKRTPAPSVQEPAPSSPADLPTAEEPENPASVLPSRSTPDSESKSEPAPAEPSPESADPFLVEEADLPGCEQLLRDFRPQMVDPLQEASIAWKEARDAIVKGDLSTAEEKMCVAVQLHPESAALESLALLYLNQQAPRRASTYLERAEKTRPDETETINLRGDIHSQLGDSEKALETWLRALKLQPDEMPRRRMAAQDFTRQGQGQLRRGAIPQAERWFRRAVTLDPENVLALTGLAEVFVKTKRFPQAASIAQRALNLSTYNPQAHVVLGDVARAQGDEDAARKSYEAALAVRSDHWPAKARLQELKAASR